MSLAKDRLENIQWQSLLLTEAQMLLESPTPHFETISHTFNKHSTLNYARKMGVTCKRGRERFV